MQKPSPSPALLFARSLAIGVLISMLFFYSIHVFGSWGVQNDRPDPETTASVLLLNKCAIFGKLHTLRPNTEIGDLTEKFSGTKLAGSFMNFFDGHIPAMIGLALMLGGVIFFIRRMLAGNR
ncbi:hypothetical protein [Ferruginibacter sp.]